MNLKYNISLIVALLLSKCLLIISNYPRILEENLIVEPKLIASHNISGDFIVLSGNYALIAEHGDYSTQKTSLKIVNIENYSQIQIIANHTLNFPEAIFCGLSVSGNYAQIADCKFGLRIFNISDKAALNQIGQYKLDIGFNQIIVSGSYALALQRYQGLHILDISDPSAPQLLGNINISTSFSLTLSDKQAYVLLSGWGAKQNGLIILDISVLSNKVIPIIVTNITIDNDILNYCDAVEILDKKYAYVSCEKGLKVLNVANPQSPTLVLNLSYWPSDQIYFSGHQAQLNQQREIAILDISNPESPRRVGSLDSYISEAAFQQDFFGIMITESKLLVQNCTPSINDNFITVTSFTNKLKNEQEYVLSVDDFYENSHQSKLGRSLRVIKIVSLPTNGTLKLLGYPVQKNDEILLANFQYSKYFVFKPDGSKFRKTSFQWIASDGYVYSNNSANVTFLSWLLDTPPEVNNIFKWGIMDAQLTFQLADFTEKYQDEIGDPLIQIQILSLPSTGSLQLSGNKVKIEQLINAEDIKLLVFQPKMGWEGNTKFRQNAFNGFNYSKGANVAIFIQKEEVQKKAKVAFWNTSGLTTRKPLFGFFDTQYTTCAFNFNGEVFFEVQDYDNNHVYVNGNISIMTGTCQFKYNTYSWIAFSNIKCNRTLKSIINCEFITKHVQMTGKGLFLQLLIRKL